MSCFSDFGADCKKAERMDGSVIDDLSSTDSGRMRPLGKKRRLLQSMRHARNGYSNRPAQVGFRETPV